MSSDKTITAYKSFNSDWTCRGFQYEVGKTYTHDGEVAISESGFHACLHPLDVLRFRDAVSSKFAAVSMSGVSSVVGLGDTQIAGSEITIISELKISELIEATANHAFDDARLIEFKSAAGFGNTASVSGENSVAVATGGCGTASVTGGGRSRAITTGTTSIAAATNDWSAAYATDHRSAAIATGYMGAAWAASPGGAAIATGHSGGACAADSRSAALAINLRGHVMGFEGSALFACERAINDGPIMSVACGIVGQNGLKPGVWYEVKSGKFVVSVP